MITNQFHKQILTFFFFLFINVTSFSQPSTSEWQKLLIENPSLKVKADICFKLAVRYFDRLKFDSALYYLHQIKKFSEEVNYEVGIGKYYLAKAIEFHLRNKTVELQDVVDKAIKIFIKHNDNLHLGLSYRMLAKNKSLNTEYDQSIKIHQKALSAFRVELNDSEIMKTCYDLGHVYTMSNRFDSAAICLLTALQYSEKLGDKRLIFMTSSELGVLYDKAGETDKGGYYHEYALKNQPPGFTKILIRNSWEYYANYLIEKKSFHKADSAVKEYENLSVILKDSFGVLQGKLMRGKIHYQGNDFHAALKEFRNSYKLINSVKKNFSNISGITLLIGMTELKVGEPDSAIFYLKYARNNLQIYNDLQFEADACLLLAEAYKQKKEMDSAYHYSRLNSFFTDSIYIQRKQKAVLEITTRYETGKKEQEIKILQKESEANDYLLKLNEEQLQKQDLESQQKSNQLALVSKQNEINKLDAIQMALSLDNEKKDNEKNQEKLNSLEKESALQTVIARNQKQRKNFAYGLIASILIFSGYGYYRYQQNKKLSSQLSYSLAELKQAQSQLIKIEKEKESENIRVRISRDIHDEVGATLSGVALFSEIAKQRMEEHNELDAKIYLDHISANSKDMVEKMGDIVWTINPENDSIDRIVARLKAYAVNLCGGKGIQVHFLVDESIKNFFPGMPERKNIYLFSKEAINNAVKYSNGSNIFFSMLKKDNMVALEIKDDGKGFDTKSIEKGNGLINMEARAAELNAALDVQSETGVGTCIKLHINFHPNGGQQQLV